MYTNIDETNEKKKKLKMFLKKINLEKKPVKNAVKIHKRIIISSVM